MTQKLNILSLHRMGDPLYWREAVKSLEYMMPTYASEHNCIIHDATFELPEYIKEIEFHAVILGPTFLCMRYTKQEKQRAERGFAWLAEKNALKIAMPQDDYDCSAILDEWMVRWKVDLLFTVCPEHWDVLYPKYSSVGIIKLGYTGYISDHLIDIWEQPKAYKLRGIDVSYRAANLPANFGSTGHLKGDIASRFVSAVASEALVLDISTDPNNFIPGVKWHEFVENSKFCLVTPSGSSLHDPCGEYRECVSRSKGESYDEVRDECFPGKDGNYVFTMISPRNIEAALACTVQIATPGTYSDIIYPYEHYIPLEENCSNISDVLSMMADKQLIQNLRVKCKEAMLDKKGLRYSNHVAGIVNFIEENLTDRNIQDVEQKKIESLYFRYYQEIDVFSEKHWKKRRVMLDFRRGMQRVLGGKATKTLSGIYRRLYG